MFHQLQGVLGGVSAAWADRRLLVPDHHLPWLSALEVMLYTYVDTSLDDNLVSNSMLVQRFLITERMLVRFQICCICRLDHIETP